MSLSCLTGPILDIVRTAAGTGNVRELQNVTVLLGGSSSRQCQGFILNCQCYTMSVFQQAGSFPDTVTTFLGTGNVTQLYEMSLSVT